MGQFTRKHEQKSVRGWGVVGVRGRFYGKFAERRVLDIGARD